MKKTETEQILEYLKHIYESINGPLPEARQSSEEPPLTKRVGALQKEVDGLTRSVGKLDDRVGKLDSRVGKLDSRVGKLDSRVGKLDDRVGKLDSRVSEVQLGLATLAVTTKQRFDSVDVQFAGVRGAIESTRVQLVDLIGSVHSELTGRIIDLEVPGPGGRGGSPSGSGGVPLAS